MKPKFILLAFFGLILLQLGCSSSKSTSYKMKSNYQVISDSKSAKPIISGAIEWDEWKDKSLWNLSAIESKSADILLSKSVCKVINNGDYFLLIYAGSWSENAESQLPIIFKIFEKGELKLSKYQLCGIDRNNKGYELDKIPFTTHKVPTIIVLYNGKEIGRVEEFPSRTWEQDILSIIYKN